MNDNYEKYLEGMIAQAKTGLSTAEQYHCDGMIEGFKWSLERYRKFKAEQSHKAIVDLNGLIGCPNCHCAVDVSDAHNPEQGLVEELRRWSNGCMRRGPDGEPDGCFGIMEFEEILSRHTAKVDKDKEVEPKEDK